MSYETKRANLLAAIRRHREIRQSLIRDPLVPASTIHFHGVRITHFQEFLAKLRESRA